MDALEVFSRRRPHPPHGSGRPVGRESEMTRVRRCQQLAIRDCGSHSRVAVCAVPSAHQSTQLVGGDAETSPRSEEQGGGAEEESHATRPHPRHATRVAPQDGSPQHCRRQLKYLHSIASAAPHGTLERAVLRALPQGQAFNIQLHCGNSRGGPGRQLTFARRGGGGGGRQPRAAQNRFPFPKPRRRSGRRRATSWKSHR